MKIKKSPATILIIILTLVGCLIGIFYGFIGHKSRVKSIEVNFAKLCKSYEDTTYISHKLGDFPASIQPVTISIRFDTVITLGKGNFILPSISPDEKKMAFAKLVDFKPQKKDSNIILYPQTDLTTISQIICCNFIKRTKKIIIDSQTTKKYGVYSAVPASIAWRDTQNIKLIDYPPAGK